MIYGKKKPAYAVAGGIFYGLQFIESLTSNTWSYLCNIQTPEQASDRVREMISAKPICAINIQNFHYEEVVVEQKVDNKDLIEFENRQKELQNKRDEIDKKLEELKQSYFKDTQI